MQDSVGIKSALGKALIADNGYPLSKSITQHKALLNQPLGATEQFMLYVASVFKGIPLIKRCALIINCSVTLKLAS